MSAPTERSPYYLRHLVSSSLQSWLFHALHEELGEDVFFLQIGANDGKSFDPLRERILQHKWSGILVEPVPTMYAALQANYAGSPGLTFVQTACADRVGTMPFFQIKNEKEHPWDGLKGLSSFNPAHIRAHLKSEEEFEKYVEQVTVNVVTAEQLLETHGVQRVDILLIDTEGADAKVLDGFEVEQRLPKLVMLEHLHLTVIEKDRVYDRMHQAGYQRCVGVLDSFFFLPSFCTSKEIDTLSIFRNAILSL